MAKELILSTTHALPNRQASDVLGIVFGTTIRTRGVLGRFMAGIEAMTGGKSNAYIVELDKARDEAIENMKAKASELGADAVVGVDLDISEVLEGYIMVTATGTAVKLK